VHLNSFVPLNAIRPTYFINLAHLFNPILLSEQNKLWNSSLCSLLHSPVISSITDPNISLSTPFSTTLGLRTALNVRDKFSRR
jgi:hypothetical protein